MIEEELEKEPSLKEILHEVFKNRFDVRSPVPSRPNYSFLIHNQKSGKESGIALEGSIIAFSGQSKTRKSSAMAMFASAILNKDGFYGNVHTTIKSGTVLWFDTEQNEIEFNYFQKMIYRMAGVDSINPNINYVAFNIRKYTEEQRYAIVNGLIKNLKDVVLVVIDGIADLASSVNDMAETKKLVTRMCWWADTYKTPIFTTIHTNKDGKDATGSLGGFLDKKCSYHIRTSKEDYDGPTKVVPWHSRGGEGFTPFEFEHNGNGLPTVLVEHAFIGAESDESIGGPAGESSDIPF